MSVDAAADLAAFVAALRSDRREDVETLMALFARATGEQPHLDRGMICFGTYAYRYPSGRSGHAAAAGFAPRSGRIVVYLMDGTAAHTVDLDRLGPHRRAVGTIEIPRLDDVDLDVLAAIVARSFQRLTDGVYTRRARDGGR